MRNDNIKIDVTEIGYKDMMQVCASCYCSIAEFLNEGDELSHSEHRIFSFVKLYTYIPLKRVYLYSVQESKRMFRSRE
jgi:hypothetical protein